jgi:uncharacterized membrane protein YecN with MAPEG domain
MASVWIERPCSEPEDLPDACVRCGEETTRRSRRTFTWVPAWTLLLMLLGLLPYYAVAAVLRKKCRVSVPICDRHKDHWLLRSIVALGSFVFFIPAGIGLMILLVTLTEGTGWEPLSLLGCGSGIFGWFAFIVLVNYAAIRAAGITDDAVKLTGVCPAFIDAYHEFHDQRKQRRRAAKSRDDREQRPRRERDAGRDSRDEGSGGYREEDDRPGRRRDRDEEDY